MTLTKLRWLVLATAVLLVALLDLVRLYAIGATSLTSRILLDAVVGAVFLTIALFMLRAIGRMQRRLERQNEELLALHGAGVDVTAELSLDVVLQKVIDRARALVGAHYGALSVVNDDGSIRAFITSGISDEVRARIGPPPVGHGLLGVVLREGERLRVADIGSHPRSHGFPPNHPEMRSLLAVPVNCKGPFVGNLYLSEKESGAEFTERDEETLERFAVHASIAIDNADLHSRAERQNRELLALHAAGLDVTAELSLEAVLDKVVGRARDLAGARYGALSVVNDDGSIQAFITSGISAEERARIGPPPVGHGLLGVVLREGERLRLTDIGKDSRSHGFPPNHPTMHSLLAVPLTCKGPFAGNLYLSEKESGAPFTESDEETLERFATQASIAIDNAYLHRQAADLAVARERLHMAHELHDGVAQVLGYVNTKAQAAIQYLRRDEREEGINQLHELVGAAREAHADVRQAIVDLRTLPEPSRSFEDVLREYVDRWREQTGIATELVVDGDLVVTGRIELQLVRIIQESLTNVRKHAQATSAKVEVQRRPGKLLITVTDDGVGLARTADGPSVFAHFGLTTMHERAQSIGAVLSVDSLPSAGTAVRIELPLSVN